MNKNLWLLSLCQGLFLTNNVVFIAINGLVGLQLAPYGWMATLPVMGYVVGGALSTALVARTQRRWGRQAPGYAGTRQRAPPRTATPRPPIPVFCPKGTPASASPRVSIFMWGGEDVSGYRWPHIFSAKMVNSPGILALSQWGCSRNSQRRKPAPISAFRISASV